MMHGTMNVKNKSINHLVFVMQAQYVLCYLGNEFSNIV